MNELSTQHPGDIQAAIQSAADELAGWLAGLADRVAAKRTARAIEFGPGRVRDSLRRHSPKGFPVTLVGGQRVVLLPDGRLWTYTRSDARRFPAGRIYDARTDHVNFSAARTFPGGAEFRFLGAVVGRYTFGFTFGFVDGSGASVPSGLCALLVGGNKVKYVSPRQAFDALAASMTGPEDEGRA